MAHVPNCRGLGLEPELIFYTKSRGRFEEDILMECILCGKSIDGLQDESVVHKPTKQGLQTICSAAEKRQDTSGIRILEKKYAILDGTLKVKFHKTCRKTYTSNMNIASATTSETDDLLNQATACSKTTRSHTGSFDIRSMCLICNKTGPRKIRQKKEKLTSVQTGNYILFEKYGNKLPRCSEIRTNSI
ncbi:unnamed protein product [Ceutorhynchus assimilis]|uniref:Uncharacterized protein n=1 Tax=Ceutorhynchus assimilis TaxID=467358 RepID=A0A9N9MIL4_9CUCU|nr:unnamed protein product [Ceutorhynchus assimilis]